MAPDDAHTCLAEVWAHQCCPDCSAAYIELQRGAELRGGRGLDALGEGVSSPPQLPLLTCTILLRSLWAVLSPLAPALVDKG